MKRGVVTGFLAVALGLAATGSAQEPPPTNLVFELRLFEAREPSPDLAKMHGLSFFISTDGTGVRANQWLSTLATKVPEGFIAALRWDTLSLADGEAVARWTNRARSFDVRVRPASFHATKPFQVEVTTELKRGAAVLRTFTRPVELQVGRTTVWSSKDLEIHRSEYISHFREVDDGESRGLLYAGLDRFTIFLVMTLTPRLATQDALAPRESLVLPPETRVPDIDNPFDGPLTGTVLLGFDIEANGTPGSPQILLSTIPEANNRVLGEASKWSFPAPAETAGAPRRGKLEIKVRVPPP